MGPAEALEAMEALEALEAARLAGEVAREVEVARVVEHLREAAAAAAVAAAVARPGEAGAREALRGWCEETWRETARGGGWRSAAVREAFVGVSAVRCAAALDCAASASGGLGSGSDRGGEDDVDGLVLEASEALDGVLLAAGLGEGGARVEALRAALEPLACEAWRRSAAGRAGAGLEGDVLRTGGAGACAAPAGASLAGGARDRQVTRVPRLPVRNFCERFYAARRPVVVGGGAVGEGWPAWERWGALAYLRGVAGHRLVPIELGVHGDGTWRERVMRVHEFIDRYLATAGAHRVGEEEEEEEEKVAYLAQHALFGQVLGLREDFWVPEAWWSGMEGGRSTGTYVWLGTEGTRTPLHYDGDDNLLVQVAGWKRVRLYAPEEALAGRLHVVAAGGEGAGGSYAQGNLSAVGDPENVEAMGAAYPGFADAQWTEALLGPGDALFIPAGHWHYVRSLERSLSVSFFFRTAHTGRTP